MCRQAIQLILHSAAQEGGLMTMMIICMKLLWFASFKLCEQPGQEMLSTIHGAPSEFPQQLREGYAPAGSTSKVGPLIH